MTDAKVRIDLSQGIVEAEGSEAFVRAIYDDFKTQVSSQVSESPAAAPKKKTPKAKTPPNGDSKKPRSSKGKASTPSIVKDLNLRPKGKTGLRDFYNQYKANSNLEKNLVFVYWLQEEAGVANITEDHVFTCYRDIPGVKAPAAMYQSLIDTSRRKGWLDTTDTDDVKVTIPGVNHIEHDLPKADD